MDRIIIFHIGLHRTATTFLQSEVFPNLNGCHFINHHEIYEELVNLTTSDEHIWKKAKLIDKTKACIDNKLGEGINVISAECLTGFPFYKSMNRSLILKRIKEMFPSAKIIVGIREQVEILSSLYFLYIREGGTLKLRDLLKKKDKNYFGYTIYDNLIETIDLDAYKYSILVEQLYGLFSKENVHVFVLEEFKSDSNSINNLLTFLEVDDLHRSNSIQNKVNKSYPLNSLEMIRKVNKVSRGFTSKGRIRTFQKKYVNKIIKRIFVGEGKHLFSNIDIDIYDYYKEDNVKLSDLLPKSSEYFENYNKMYK